MADGYCRGPRVRYTQPGEVLDVDDTVSSDQAIYCYCNEGFELQAGTVIFCRYGLLTGNPVCLSGRVQHNLLLGF